MKSRLLSAAVLILTLTSCTSVRFTSAKRATIRQASVVARPANLTKDKITVFTQGQAWGAQFGLIGALASLAAGQDDRSRLIAAFNQFHIDAGLQLAEAFSAQIQRDRVVPIVKAASDAHFDFKVTSAGLTVGGAFASKLFPFITAEGTLTRNDGTVLWHYSTQYLAQEFRRDIDLYKDPETIRTGFRIAAEGLAREFVDDMRIDLGDNSVRDPVLAAEDRAAAAQGQGTVELRKDRAVKQSAVKRR